MKIQAGVAGTVYLDEERNLGGAWLKQASRLYENLINTVCLADTLAILGYAVDANHIKTALARRVKIEVKQHKTMGQRYANGRGASVDIYCCPITL
jgi:hypothetical protein